MTTTYRFYDTPDSRPDPDDPTSRPPRPPATAPNRWDGATVRTRIADEDEDEDGQQRLIPVGTVGTVQPLGTGETHNVFWENGGWTCWTPEELDRDADDLEPRP